MSIAFKNPFAKKEPSPSAEPPKPSIINRATSTGYNSLKSVHNYNRTHPKVFQDTPPAHTQATKARTQGM